MAENRLTFELRELPSISSILEDKKLRDLSTKTGMPKVLLVRAVRKVVQGMRNQAIRPKADEKGLSRAELREIALRRVEKQLCQLARRASRRVVNATGILVHTNLGRSPFSQELWAQAGKVLTGYLNLEYELESGSRSKRGIFVEELLRVLTDAEGALVVNNNAGAVFLILRSLCYRKEVIVSRGELVQIGGGFRIPEIMKASGAKLVEVGTTNKTSVGDYENAITRRTAAILKVHKSNFQQIGFVGEASTEELAELAKRKSLMLIEDMGAATVVDQAHATRLRLNHPSPSLKLGVDVVCFSADKILGLCQGGIILGRYSLIEKMRSSPIYRTLRPDRTLLTILELGLTQIASGEWHLIPFYRLLLAEVRKLKSRARKLAKALEALGISCSVKDSIAEIGGGFAGGRIPSYAVAIPAASVGSVRKLEKLARLLRLADTPIIAKIQDNELLIDFRSVFEEEDDKILKAFKSVSKLI